MSVTFARSVALKAIRTYKVVVSPYLPVACRFSPTCSEYAFEAVEQYGLLRGFLRALLRLLRCHPLHRGGFDPLT
jgi:putative membrane protein insertion efficiency factor